MRRTRETRGTRRTERFAIEGQGPNTLWQMYRTISRWKVYKNFIVIQMARYCPSLRLKRWLYRRLLHMDVGKHTAFALMAMVDLFFPEKIRVGSNSIIGYNTTILTHEYLIDEYRVGEVEIGSNVMIGANVTILPGVRIGDGAIVGAGSVVHKDVAAGSFVAGSPLRVIKAAGASAEAGAQVGSGATFEAEASAEAGAQAGSEAQATPETADKDSQN